MIVDCLDLLSLSQGFRMELWESLRFLFRGDCQESSMTKKKDEPEERDNDILQIPEGVAVDLTGVNFSISLESSKKSDSLESVALLGLNIYKHLIEENHKDDPGVR